VRDAVRKCMGKPIGRREANAASLTTTTKPAPDSAFVPSSYAFAAHGGASGVAPGHEMQQSFKNPHQRGAVRGASRFAPGHGM
jgi:hypothetical protein